MARGCDAPVNDPGTNLKPYAIFNLSIVSFSVREIQKIAPLEKAPLHFYLRAMQSFKTSVE